MDVYTYVALRLIQTLHFGHVTTDILVRERLLRDWSYMNVVEQKVLYYVRLIQGKFY